MGLLDSSSGRGRLPGSLGGQLLPGRGVNHERIDISIYSPRSLASGGLPGSLLGASHGEGEVWSVAELTGD